ncbi:MAG: oligosaccharide flippase family protein [Ignavibacteriales bacterium]
MKNVKGIPVGYDSSVQIRMGAMASYLTIFLSIIAGLLYTPWMIRTIGKSDYGLFILVTSFLTYFVMDFGLGSTIARYISRYRAEEKEVMVKDLLGLTVRIYLILDIVLFFMIIAFYFVIHRIFTELSAEELVKFKITYIILGAFSLINLPSMSLNGILIAYERFILLRLCDLFNRLFTIALMILAVFAGYRLLGLVVVNVLVGMSIIIVKLAYLSGKIRIKINLRYKNRALLKELFGFSALVTVIGIAQRLIINITPAILGIFSGTTQIAVFAIGLTFEGYTWTFASSLNGLFLPRVSQMSAKQGSREEITNLMIRVGRLQLIITGLLFVGIITLGREFIILWMGTDFSSSYFVALLLILPETIILTQEIGNTLVFVENSLKYVAILYLASSVVSAAISVMLAPRYGAVGSSAGIFTALILCHVTGMNIIYYKVLKVNIFRFFRECHLKLFLPFSLSLAAGFLIEVCVPAHSLMTFLPKILLLIPVYIILMWFLGLTSEEKLLARTMAGKVIYRLKAA